MKSHPLAYILFAIGTIGGVLDFSTDLWLSIAACLFLWLLVLTFNQSLH